MASELTIPQPGAGTMSILFDTVGRTMLKPALRLMRLQMKLVSDPVLLRNAARSVDALGRRPDARTQHVTAGSAPATWIDVKGAHKDRVVLYLHGGAFVAETPLLHGALLARICAEAHARGLMLSYRLSPEHRYPAALDDCVAAYRWLLEQGFAPDHIVVAGDSAGGNLTLALLLRLRDEALHLPAGAVALSPVADLTFSGDSIRRNDGVDDMFSAEMMEPLVPVYLSQRSLRTHPHVSPVFGDYTGLPPCCWWRAALSCCWMIRCACSTARRTRNCWCGTACRMCFRRLISCRRRARPPCASATSCVTASRARRSRR